MEKKSSKIILIVIFILLIVGGFFTYKYINDNKDNPNPVEKPKTIVKKLTINDEIVKTLYSYLSFESSNFVDNEFFKNKKVTYNTLKDPVGVVLYNIHSNATSLDEVKLTKTMLGKNYDSVCPKNSKIPCYGQKMFTKKEYENKYRSIFGTQVDIKYPTLNELGSRSYALSNDNYVYYSRASGSRNDKDEIKSLVNVTNDSENIYLYIKQIVRVYTDVDTSLTCKSVPVNDNSNLYSDTTRKNIIACDVAVENNDNLLKQYSDKIPTYKVNFKLDKNTNTYYFYSSEIE